MNKESTKKDVHSARKCVFAKRGRWTGRPAHSSRLCDPARDRKRERKRGKALVGTKSKRSRNEQKRINEKRLAF